MNGWSAIGNRINALELANARAAGFVAEVDRYQFRVAPSCPPSKRLHVRGGRNACSWNRGMSAWDYAEYRMYTVPDLVADLGDHASVTPVPSFATAHYYQSFFLCLRLPAVAEQPTAADWTFYLHGDGSEFETTAEAESHFHSTAFLNYNLWDDDALIGSTYQLCGVVLRNDGQIGVDVAFLPIDVINRGRSYTWPRDVRPRQPIDS